MVFLCSVILARGFSVGFYGFSRIYPEVCFWMIFCGFLGFFYPFPKLENDVLYRPFGVTNARYGGKKGSLSFFTL